VPTAEILLVNFVKRFDSSLRDPDDIIDHIHIDRIVGEIIEMFDSINRNEGEISANPCSSDHSELLT